MKKLKASVQMIHPRVEQGDIAPHIKEVLSHLGEDPSREGLQLTPARVEKALRYLTSGYATDLDSIVNGAIFEVQYDEMVIVKDIEFYSMCEHHMLPFFGKMHVAYLAKNKVLGLSKIPRIVDAFARRLQIQERLTQQVAHHLQEMLEPHGVGVICEASHFCMMMRGVQKQGSTTVTSTMLGMFRNRKATRDEFLSLVRSK
jgi:GTP cyclohydrolase IA